MWDENRKEVMKKLFIIILCVCLPVALSAKDEEVVLQTPTGSIYGTLSIPDAKQPIPVVLLIAGSGPTDRNGNQPMMNTNMLKMLSDSLVHHGIAALRYDKRGIGESKDAGAKEEDLRFEDYIDDACLWIDLLCKDSRISSVTVCGHSEGSLIGMVAAGFNPNVKSFISLAGSALPAGEIMEEQMGRQPQQVKDMVLPILKQLKNGEQVSDVSPMLYALFRPSVQPYMISWMKYDPREEIKKLKIPVLLLQGTTDMQVAEEHADMLAEACPSAKKVIVEGINHILKKCDSKDQAAQIPVYTNPNLPVSEEVIASVTDFVK
jgi:pimeloyl-ACP methyl ester carboxylesterase